MREIQSIANLKIHDGKLDAFKRTAEKCMQSVRTKDSGTLQYDLFLSDDQKECVVIERYRDSDALLEHLDNLGGLMKEMMDTSAISGVILGCPSEKLIKGIKDAPIKLYAPFMVLAEPESALADDATSHKLGS